MAARQNRRIGFPTQMFVNNGFFWGFGGRLPPA
jgi:hypothetical protein